MTIGETLRKAREAHGLSIEDVKNATLMMTRQIEELENDDFSSFAAPVYGKGFIRLYARTVGLDPDPLVAEYLALTARRADPSRDQPLVPLETIAEDGGAIEVVRPEPHPASHEHAPAPELPRAPESARAPEAPPPDDLFAAAEASAARAESGPAPEKPDKDAPFEKRAAPLPPPDRPRPEKRETFEKRVAPPAATPERPAGQNAPLPEKRLAPVAPGTPPPEPQGSSRVEVRKEVRITFPDSPAVKRLPEETEEERLSVSSSARPVAPRAVPLSVPPFVFPEPESDATDEPIVAAPSDASATVREPGPFRMRLRGIASAARDRLSALKGKVFARKPKADAAEDIVTPEPRRPRPALLDAEPDEETPRRTHALAGFLRSRRFALIAGAVALVVVLALLLSRCSSSARRTGAAAEPAEPAASAEPAPPAIVDAPPADPAPDAAPESAGEDWSVPRRILEPPRAFAR